MKPFLLTTNIILLGVIAWLLFRKQPVQTQLPVKEVPGAPKVCINCDNETAGQTFGHFQNVVKNYRTEHWDLINQMNFQKTTKAEPYNKLVSLYPETDARCIWFPLETIKKFICTIEKYNDSLISPNKELGIRFYYAVYENDYLPVEKQNRHTLFMVPTYSASPGSPQIDFDPRETCRRQIASKGRNREMVDFVSLGRQNNTPQNAAALRLVLADNDGGIPQNGTPANNMIQNTGELCPQNCPTPNTFSVIDP